MTTTTPLVDELFRRRGAPLAHFKCATCPISVGCYEECLRADDLCEIAELRAEVARLKAQKTPPPWPRARIASRRNGARDRAIIADHQTGCTIASLAERHGITPQRVATIIRLVRLDG